MASSRPQPLLDLDLTIVSAKHLKNVNWRHGDLKPYAIFWLDSDRKLATKPDDSGSTRPVWNERFTLPITLALHDSLLTLEIFHSKPSETPKPLVATLRSPLKDIILDSDESTRIKTLDLWRPSGRPQGKIRIKLAVREHPAPPVPDYHTTLPSGYYYSSTPPPPTRDYRGYYGNPNPNRNPIPLPPAQSQYPYGNYANPYSGYYSGYYSPPPPPQPLFDRVSGYGGPGGPSAPVDFSSSSASSMYEQRPKGGKMGIGTGSAVGAVAGALGGLALEEGVKYEEEKISERVERDLAARDDYSDYRNDY